MPKLSNYPIYTGDISAIYLLGSIEATSDTYNITSSDFYDYISDRLGLVPQLPAGGAAGQVLEKTDNTDYNVQWSTRVNIQEISQVGYDALPSPDTNTLYLITS